MATLIKANGEAYPISPKNGKTFTLEECYGHIQTDMIQVVPTIGEDILIIDEEGKLKDDAKLNASATALIGEGDFIVRDVIRCKPEEFE